MKYLIFIGLLFGQGFYTLGQDTLVQTNAHLFGFQQQYILHENGTFTYTSIGLCTGIRTQGTGHFESGNNSYKFKFDSAVKFSPKVECSDSTPNTFLRFGAIDVSDSLPLSFCLLSNVDTFFYDKTDLVKFKSTADSVEFKYIGYPITKFQVKKGCTGYILYTQPNAKHIYNEVHLLKKKKGSYFLLSPDDSKTTKPRKSLRRLISRRCKSNYAFKFK